MKMWLPILGTVFGILLGMLLPLKVPMAYSSYMSIAVLAAFDSVLGSLRAYLQDDFETDVFISGFFGNAFLAAGLAYLGDKLDVPIYLAAIFAFGNRMFNNFAVIRRYMLGHLKRESYIEEDQTK